MALNLQKAEFVKSAAAPDALIRDALPKIVFSGKSNVGKSSVINRVLGREGFARVGAKPGRTAHVNYFKIDGRAYFVDLPGYGYAQVAREEKARWSRLMEYFFANMEFSLGVFIVDCRHRPTAEDVTMAGWFRETGSPVVVAANKRDKVKNSELQAKLDTIRESLELGDTEIIPFSARTGEGERRLAAFLEFAARGGAGA
ncbi:MAG: ribosome biogenesis GTP-binding protein YihA/YsxC [Oscillospiraceae bacterium]|jgi:GTP-binding protein|nr:ribosome biogenesis GTP-binding protein YihA/YsxC [Oscillospiraceae bacterium]